MDGTTVVAGGEAAEVFEAIEASYDLVAVLVDGGVVRDEDFGITVGITGITVTRYLTP